MLVEFRYRGFTHQDWFLHEPYACNPNPATVTIFSKFVQARAIFQPGEEKMRLLIQQGPFQVYGEPNDDQFELTGYVTSWSYTNNNWKSILGHHLIYAYRDGIKRCICKK